MLRDMRQPALEIRTVSCISSWSLAGLNAGHSTEPAPGHQEISASVAESGFALSAICQGQPQLLKALLGGHGLSPANSFRKDMNPVALGRVRLCQLHPRLQSKRES